MFSLAFVHLCIYSWFSAVFGSSSPHESRLPGEVLQYLATGIVLLKRWRCGSVANGRPWHFGIFQLTDGDENCLSLVVKHSGVYLKIWKTVKALKILCKNT